MVYAHPWTRFVAIGDSFTEGIGDPEPTSPGGHRGWADRVAEVLSVNVPDFAYANLAIRGRLLQQIIDEQVDAALELMPDLITFSAGGNDIIRLGSDPDEVSERYEGAVARLVSSGATVVIFTGPDFGGTPVLRRARPKIAIYNENLHAIALRHNTLVADMWAVRDVKNPQMWAEDRLHLSSLGHHTVARAVLKTLEVSHDLTPMEPQPLPKRSWRQARTNDIVWARRYFAPWIMRRLRGQSSGDGITPKRPIPGPYS